MFDVSATLESVAEILSHAGIQKVKLEDLRCRLKELAPAVTGNGAVYVRDWMKLKEALNYVFSEAFERVYYEPTISEGEGEGDEWHFVASPHFALSTEIKPHLSDITASKTVKQLNAALQKADNTSTPQIILEKLQKLKRLAEAYAELVDAHRVASEKIINKKRQKTSHNISSELQQDSNFKLVSDSLKSIISGPLDKLEKELKEEYNEKIARLKAKLKRLGGKILAPGHGEAGDLSAAELQLFMKMFDYESVDSYSGKKIQSLFVNIKPTELLKTYAAEKAKQDRTEIETSFINKNANKLIAIIANKAETPTIEHEDAPKITAGSIQATLKFTFPDGAKFTVINKVIINKSQKGEAFYQYPITFHGVTLSDGTKISSPSEEKMLNQFI